MTSTDPPPPLPAQPHVQVQVEGPQPWRSLIRTLVLWLGFTVMVSVLPILGSAANSIIQNRPVVLSDLIGKGELLLVAVAILAGALGEVLRLDRPTRGVFRALLVSGCFLVTLAGVWYYAQIATLLGDRHPISTDVIIVSTFVAFALSIVAGAGCLAVVGRD